MDLYNLFFYILVLIVYIFIKKMDVGSSYITIFYHCFNYY